MFTLKLKFLSFIKESLNLNKGRISILKLDPAHLPQLQSAHTPIKID